ncbi:related to ascospore maturation 1 protein (Asm-1) [Cephalotrichum gorgonifer]|uniref:Related to ascospore maturation 1 protein (Asm-1) n=1 Tax=Cephalotrichum gorgonifer TaxID=2041049 RepID=A0AAE8MQ79_9PEZI|nr:related to ascospore maturation 1 protein (Asm-1) [Cephalotrichum gorgonifer]
MSHAHHQDMYYSQHMSTGQPHPPQTVTSGGLTHYTHQQPPLLQSGPGQYPPPPAPYHQYNYGNGLTSPPTAPPVSGNMGGGGVLPPPTPLPGIPGQAAPMQNQYSGFDTTGQVAPPGMKPRVTATLWEDEGSLCYQVEARGICVARREDNHMINGTKLLNVAGMTRGRRDGILKSEKVRHVVKIGPMHLKGVWIPFERALEFANKEKITELLYPLFVHNIGALLYHPTNQTRTSQVMAAAERRKHEQSQLRGTQPPAPGLPSIQQQHHAMSLPGPQPPLPSQTMARPPLERAHTFPTPPTSASSVMGNMGPSEGFQWGQQQGMSGAQGTNPISIDTSLNNTRSMPNTPATTPPGANMQTMQSYPPGSQQPYDSSKQQLYNPSSAHQSPYQTSAPAPQDRSLYGPTGGYVKNEMAPPPTRSTGPGVVNDQPDNRAPNGILHSDQTGQAVTHHGTEEEADHDHDAEYTHDSGYDTTRASYNYPAPAVGSIPADHSHMAPEITGSPNHPHGSGRATPRTAAQPQPYYPQQTGYSSPPRVQSTNNVYAVMNNDRGSSNAGPTTDVYAPQADMGASMSNGYAPQPPVMNGGGGSLKRQRDDDDIPRSPGGGAGMGSMDLKRRKTMIESGVPAPAYDSMSRPASAISTQRRR